MLYTKATLYQHLTSTSVRLQLLIYPWKMNLQPYTAIAPSLILSLVSHRRYYPHCLHESPGYLDFCIQELLSLYLSLQCCLCGLSKLSFSIPRGLGTSGWDSESVWVETIRSGVVFLTRMDTGGLLLASVQAVFHATQAISFKSNWSKVNLWFWPYILVFIKFFPVVGYCMFFLRILCALLSFPLYFSLHFPPAMFMC